MASAKYVHTNLIARDWRKLVQFYCDVFGCVPKPPERDLSGKWLDEQTGLQSAHLTGMHIILPGFGASGPTLEIFSYDQLRQSETPVPNQPGFTHIAFLVTDADEALRQVIAHGGGQVGPIASTEVTGVGRLQVVYARDPEGNMVELQHWD